MLQRLLFSLIFLPVLKRGGVGAFVPLKESLRYHRWSINEFVCQIVFVDSFTMLKIIVMVIVII